MSKSQIPVTVLTGFLGSGKTTLLNHLLRSPDHGLRFAIIENEFGEVGVDEKLISSKVEQSKDEVIEVMNGCICCTVRGDLVEALKRMYQRVKDFDAVLIETTGMADPAPVAQTFFVDDEIKKKYRLDGIVTVVDAKHLLTHLDEEKPEGVENESVEQLAFADRIIINKCDLLLDAGLPAEKSDVAVCTDARPDGFQIGNNTKSSSQEVEIERILSAGSSGELESKLQELEKRIRTINAAAPILRAQYSRVDPKQLLNINGFDLNRVLEMDPEFLKPESSDHQHDESVSSVARSFPGVELNVNALQDWISMLMQELGTELFRYKGVLAVKGCDEKFVFQGVHMLFAGGFSSDIGLSKGKRKPAARWQPDEQRECRFVFIGKNMKQKHGDKILEEFQKCIAPAELRFKVGEMVEARGPEGWQSAKVLKVWDEGNPYRLEVQDKRKTNVWGPFDDDRFVRASKKASGY